MHSLPFERNRGNEEVGKRESKKNERRMNFIRGCETKLRKNYERQTAHRKKKEKKKEKILACVQKRRSFVLSAHLALLL
ncbi:hypothetical protein PUN28_011414 [Cardiocondyla obscurior]|uniref:Uncharacterized protein n=1 Tax=Cardiocondyla obscurior TaxID=286306 RepID=A0AAW2FGE5_9HYME